MQQYTIKPLQDQYLEHRKAGYNSTNLVDFDELVNIGGNVSK